MDSGARRCQNKNKIQKLQMDSGARHQSQKWTTGENTSNTIINLGAYVYLFIIFDVNIFLCKMFTFYI